MKRMPWVALALAACSERPIDPGGAGALGAPSAGVAPVGVGPTTGPASSVVDVSCLDAGTCYASWSLQSSTPVSGAFEVNFVGALGTRLFLASASNNGRPQYFKSFDTATGTFRDESLDRNPFCACGYEGALLAAAGRLFYFGSDARSYRPGDGWKDVAQPSVTQTGEPAAAVLDDQIYFVGGRGLYDRAARYDATSGAWETKNVANAPTPLLSACAGAVGGKLYVFGGERIDNSQDARAVTVYDAAANRWSQLPVAADFTGYCNLQTAPTWQGRLVYADGSDTDGGNTLGLFNPTTGEWSKLPVPPGLSPFAPAVTEGGDLYLIGLGKAASTANIYKVALK
jgi:hypothetical protein